MKLADCNPRQRMAYANIYHAANWLLGGLENTMSDNTPDSAEYKSAQAKLQDHDGLVKELYDMAINDIYGDGFAMFNSKSLLRDIRFCGKEWLMERCEARIKKNGY